MLNLQVRDKEFTEEFARCLSLIFNRKVKVLEVYEKQGRGIFYKVFLASRSFYDWYTENAEEKFRIATVFPREFIKGVYDSEGSLGYTTSLRKGRILRYNIIRVSSSNIRLLELIQTILSDTLSINSTLRKNALSKPHMINGREAVWKKEVYCLGIYNKLGVNQFLDKIGSSIPRKSCVL